MSPNLRPSNGLGDQFKPASELNAQLHPDTNPSLGVQVNDPIVSTNAQVMPDKTPSDAALTPSISGLQARVASLEDENLKLKMTSDPKRMALKDDFLRQQLTQCQEHNLDLKVEVDVLRSQSDTGKQAYQLLEARYTELREVFNVHLTEMEHDVALRSNRNEETAHRIQKSKEQLTTLPLLDSPSTAGSSIGLEIVPRQVSVDTSATNLEMVDPIPNANPIGIMPSPSNLSDPPHSNNNSFNTPSCTSSTSTITPDAIAMGKRGFAKFSSDPPSWPPENKIDFAATKHKLEQVTGTTAVTEKRNSDHTFMHPERARKRAKFTGTGASWETYREKPTSGKTKPVANKNASVEKKNKS